MSKEAALAFLKKVAQDGDLQSKLVAFAAGEGYEFSVDELSEAELEAAAGGAAYLKFGTITGEALERKARTAMTADSFSFGVEREMKE